MTNDTEDVSQLVRRLEAFADLMGTDRAETVESAARLSDATRTQADGFAHNLLGETYGQHLAAALRTAVRSPAPTQETE